MPTTIDLDVQYKKAEWLALNPSELKELYFYGIKIQDKYGNEMSEETYRSKILEAQKEVESMFSLKLAPQIIQEDISFYRDEFESFGFIRTSYPVVVPFNLDGYLGQVKQISYPFEWLSSKIHSDGECWNRQIYLVPNQNAARTGTLVYNGIVPYLGILGYTTLPNYWTVRYGTGYQKLPYDLLGLIGKLAAVKLFIIAGDLVLNPGIGSQSLGIDGLSQSASISAGSAFQNRIKNYLEEVKTSSSVMRSKYKGITLGSL